MPSLSIPLHHLLLALSIFFLIYQILTTLITHVRNRRKAAKLGCLPVPLEKTKWPFGIDTVLAMARASKDQRLPDFIVSRYNTMNRYTWRTSMLGSEFFTTADPRNIQAILATQFKDFRMGVARRTNLNPVLGGSVFALDGAAWHDAREVIRPIFSREQVSDLSLLEKHWKAMLQCIPQNKNEDGWTTTVSLNALLPCLTLDSATELFLGKSTDSLAKKAAKITLKKTESEGNQGHEEDFEWAFERVQELLAARLRLRGLYWLYGGRELRHCVAILHKLCDQAMAEAVQSRREKENLDVKRYDFLEAMMERSENHAATRDHVLGLLAAGRDTTAALTSWVFYCLVRDPAVLKKLRGIVLDTFGPYNEDLETITFTALKGCTYLQHVLNEVSSFFSF